MPGIIDVYTDFADSHVELYEKKGKVKHISREKVERQLLNEIDKSEIHFNSKLSWYHAVLASSNFEALWKSISKRLKLPKSCTARLVPNETLLEYETPTDNEAEEGIKEAHDGVEEEIHDGIDDAATAAKVIYPTSIPQTPALITDHGSGSSTPDIDHSSRSSTPDTSLELDAAALLPVKRTLPPKCDRCTQRGHSTKFCPQNVPDEDIDWSSDASSQVNGGHEAKMLAKALSAGLPRGPKAVKDSVPVLHDLSEDPRAELDDLNGLAREEGDDGLYEESPSKTKGKGEAKESLTVKGASKPKGVMKKKPTPREKKQTPAQLKTAAAKTREPAKPKVTKKTSTTPGQAATTPAPASNGNYKQIQASIAPGHAVPTPVHASNSNPTPASTAPSQVATKSVHTSDGNNKQIQTATEPDELGKKIAQIQAEFAPAQAQGIKRMWEQFPDDEEDSPSTKKAKTGGAAAENVGRKMATLKKSNKKKGLQEWDGIHRGFGEY